MEALLSQLEQQKNWKQFIKKSCRKNKICVEIASYFTPTKIKSVYDRFLKIYQMKEESDTYTWIQNQLKAFHWFLVILSGLKDKKIQNFNQEQWEIMKKIFLNKDISILEYQSIKLVNERVNKNRSWTQQQTDILTEIIKQNPDSNKWNDIARKLFQRSSHQFFRSGKQCRQRWLNHLDPNKKRGQWQQFQDRQIVRFILRNGRRWSSIAKQLGNHRTQHMVKNRFKTLIIKQKKQTPKITNQNSLLREIGKKFFGDDIVYLKKNVKRNKENKASQNISSQIREKQNYSQIQQQLQQNFRQESLKDIKQEVNNEQNRYIQQLKEQKEQCNMQDLNKQFSPFKDPIVAKVLQDYSKGPNSSSTPGNNYQLQQVYTPFYFNYQGVTPYLSQSPSMPFFMNASFSTFDNAFTQNLFINNNSSEKKQEDQ